MQILGKEFEFKGGIIYNTRRVRVADYSFDLNVHVLYCSVKHINVIQREIADLKRDILIFDRQIV